MTEIDPTPRGRHMRAEIDTQPVTWRRAVDLADEVSVLPRDGERVSIVGCGTSWFMAQAYAALRESRGRGETDAFTASEIPQHRRYDAMVLLSRSGTTTEMLDLAASVRGHVQTVALVGDGMSPLIDLVDDAVVLPFADEESVVQTRFATTALAFLRASLGEDLRPAIADVESVLDTGVDPELVEADRFVFLGRGWAAGIAHEAALKMREAAQAWSESYPSMEYRHGPISVAGAGTVVWHFGPAPQGLERDVRATGARFEDQKIDPMAELVRVQLAALARGTARGLEPDSPRHLQRAVVLNS